MIDIQKLQAQCNQIEVITAQIMENSERYSSSLFSLLQLLYNFGFRYSDAVFSEWTLVQNTPLKVLILQQKTSVNRLISVQETDTLNWENMIRWREEAAQQSYSHLLLTLKRCNQTHLKAGKKKEMGLHLFRHLYIKKAYLSTLDLRETMALAGLTSLKTTLGYVMSDLDLA